MGGESVVMMQLSFELNKQFINRTDSEDPVADSQHYLYAHFDFVTEEWQNKVVTAIFTKDDKSYFQLLDTDGDCAVPSEVIKEGHVYVSAFANNLVTANQSRVYIKKSGYVSDGENTDVTPNIYNQIVSQLNEMRVDIFDMKDKIENIDGGLFTDWEEG